MTSREDCVFNFDIVRLFPKQAEAEVVPSSSLVEDEVEFEVSG